MGLRQRGRPVVGTIGIALERHLAHKARRKQVVEVKNSYEEWPVTMRVANYPIWLSIFMLLGPSLMVSWIGLKDSNLIWTATISGACMLIFVLFYLSKRLHEHMEEVEALRKLLQDERPGANAGQVEELER